VPIENSAKHKKLVPPTVPHCTKNTTVPSVSIFLKTNEIKKYPV